MTELMWTEQNVLSLTQGSSFSAMIVQASVVNNAGGSAVLVFLFCNTFIELRAEIR